MMVDACSIFNFAAINRMSLFEVAMRGRGQWTQAVEGEVRRSSLGRWYQPLKALLDGRWLGEAIELDSDEDREAIQNIRAALGGVSAEPLKHLGEAETIRAIESYPGLENAIFLTDDRDATYLASNRGITVRDTVWLMADAYSMGDMRCPEPYEVLQAMWDAERGIMLPDTHEAVCP
jgi:hypothetical protein